MPAGNSFVPTLELIGGVLPNRLVQLVGEDVRIGRDPSSEVWLDLRRVSWRHARIFRDQDGSYHLEDLESYNSTYLEGKKIPPRAPTPLKDGSKIRICDVTLVFLLQAIEVMPGDATILGTLDDVSSFSLASRTQNAAAVLRAVLEINRILGGTTELNEVLGRALQELFSIFGQAECGFILTRESDGKLNPRATRHRDGKGPPPTLSQTVLDHVMLEGKAILISDVQRDSRFLSNDSFNSTGIRTAICVPVSGREGPPIGIIQLDSRVKQVSFDQADLELLAAVAVPIGVVVENHGLLEVKASLAAAVEVQAGLLPRKRPVIAGYSFWERYQPALEVGGDYYDYIPVEDGPPVGCARWAVAVGDVAGKGMPAALLMANLCAEVRHLVRSGAVPNVVARRANLHVYEADLPGRFVTLALAEIDAATHQITLANAGHMPPLVRRADGTVTTIGTEEDSGLPLGIKRDETYGTITTVLAPGEVVVMFTDGVTDAMNKKDQPFGSDNLRKAVATAGRGPSQVGDDVLRALRAHVGSRPQFDDIALVCFGRD